jgi:recombination protein RecA
MAKKKDDTQTEQPIQEMDAAALSKLLIRSFNKDEAKTGKIAWNLLDENSPTDVKEFISTGNTLLDYCIANREGGGVPVGKLTEISGEEASGKSLVCAHIAKNTQAKGGVVAYLDSENAMNPEFAQQIGVDLKRMIYIQPGTVEEAGAAIEKMILLTRQKSPNQLVTIIWDSVTQTPTRVEVEGEYDINMNVQMEKPKALGKMMRKLIDVIGKERICLVFTGQLKFKPGVMYGDPTFVPGGKAVPYASSVRIQLKRGGTEKEGGDKESGEIGKGDVMGVNTTAKVIKNRMGPPLRKCKFFISFAHGVEDEESWFEFLCDRGVFEKNNGFVRAPEFQPILQQYWLDEAKKAKEQLAKEQDPEKQVQRLVKTFEEYAAKAVPNENNKYGWQFRGSAWMETLNETPALKPWILKKLDELLVVKYGAKPVDAELDEESMVECDQVISDLIDPQ